ncbi:N-acetyltransferase [Vibrio cincinnatiensis]|uniref:GNAT family N-acetyltransferase n=1 Tax=Vibrio cincinnatiensis TaxID=675 RepID=UPI001EE02925|nr:GNAT family protein [Vibrio cincinnatiensis]MCG3759628.1 N-acetyltransferase [Vibrio cincinnatiensis]MCG3762907.1 N-acetyltransferase [Vibrio cincinnatiensis]
MHCEFLINTQHLHLRLLTLDDSPALSTLIRTSSSLHQWIDWCHPAFTQEEADRFILATRLNWVKARAYGFAIIQKSTQQLVGMVAINEFYPTFNMASLGYWIGDAFQRQGMALEALNAITEWCFSQLQLTRLEIVCDPENLPSQHLAAACGAKKEYLAKNRYLFHGKPKAGVIFSLIPEDVEKY